MIRYVCPTMCDADCADDYKDGIVCHEGHYLRKSWVHDYNECMARQRRSVERTHE